MNQDILFGEWKPDLPPLRSDGLVAATNVYAGPNGYRPVQAIAPITGALAGFGGGAAYVGSNGTAALLAGAADGLHLHSAGWSMAHAVAAPGRWRFAQFGDLVIAVHGGAPVKFDLLGGTAAALGGGPPDAGLIATVRDFVVLAGDPGDILTVTWSGFNDAEVWVSGTNQSDDQQMLEGGEVTGLAGGEYGIILQRNRIVRMQYVGGDMIFQFDEISANIGCIASGSVAQAGKLIFFLSERGFMKCDGTDVAPIGNERVDRTFFASYPRADLAEMHAGVDPRNFLVVWAMPGNPGTLWIYNWALDRWSQARLPVAGLFSGFTANVSLEGVDGIYPGGIDGVPVSLDDPGFAGGDPLLLAVSPEGTIGPLAGARLPAAITAPLVEPVPGRFARLNNSSPMTDGTAGVTVTDAVRVRAGDPASATASADMRPNGDVPIRANGRFHQLTVAIDDQRWSYLQGVTIDVTAGGGR